MTQDWERGRPDRRGLVVIGMLAVALVSVLLAGRVGPGDPGDLVVEESEGPLPAPGPTPRSADEPGLDPVGHWRELPDAPLRPRTYHLTVWTGREMLVWGGLADDQRLHTGAAYDPAADTWRRLPDWGGDLDPPLAAVWTGEEMIVLGGHAAAAYHPVADRWRWLPTPPEGEWAWAAAGWAEGLLVVVEHDRRRAIGYEPGQDLWHDLPPPPVVGWVASSSVAVGGGDLVVSGLGDRSVAFTRWMSSDWTWTPAAPAPPDEWWIPWLASSGDDVIAAGHAGAWRWTGSDWIALPSIPPPLLRAGWLRLAWTGDSLLAWAGDSRRNGVVLLNGKWRQMAPAPIDVRRGSSAVWTGSELLVWGEHGGAAFRLDEEGWAHAPPPPDGPLLDGAWRAMTDVPLVRDSPSLTWTGTELLVWGGAGGRPTNTGAAWDPATDTWRPMAEAPLHPRLLHQAVWTGTEMVVWGGTTMSGAINDGAVYDPAADAWQALPPAPIEQLGMTLAVWTGHEVVVVTGPADKVAAAYDPAAGTWRRQPDLPRTGNLTGAVWTGEEIVVVTDALVGTVLRFDGAEWRFAADLDGPRATYGMEVGWTGREVIVWGGAVDAGMREGYAYDPATDVWRTLPRPWFLGSLQAAQAPWTGTHTVLSGQTVRGRAFGAYRPDEDRWYALPAPPPGPLLDGPLAWTGEELVVWSMHGPPLVFRPQ